ncbi:MAG: hydroxyphenylacetyl-CoA thioesterase PaaI [Chloroflexi bacterium]|nr:hydroxyphenylacetyl-CoA thioesterase PaaI [Chloroflexota bacterium]
MTADCNHDTASAVARFVRERDRFARHIGLELLEVRPGYARTAVTVAREHLNGMEMPHGGLIFSLADLAFAAACNSHGQTAVALSMDIHFLAAAAVGDRLEAEAVEVNLTERTGLYRILVTDPTRRSIAELHGMAFRKRGTFLPNESNEP